jgi:phosphoribosyl 1,2-cyclic phosphodiesterase
MPKRLWGWVGWLVIIHVGKESVIMTEAKKSNLVFWGVRGTCPSSGKNTNKYGGHTPCSTVETSDGSILIIDAGTGIKELGDKLLGARGDYALDLHIFLTHFHLDHIMGLPFFGPLYSPNFRLAFYCDCLPEETEEHLSGLMGGRYFPVSFQETQAEKIFHQVPKEGFEVGGNRVSFYSLNHPQGSVAYKIKGEHETIVIATDTEHPQQGIDRKLAEFAAGSNIFVYDATYTPAEYQSGRIGWGHSTWLEGTKLAKEAGVKKLFLSHLNPDHQDSQIDEIVSLAREEFAETYGARERSG